MFDLSTTGLVSATLCLILCTCGVGKCDMREISFDNGEVQKTTVIGLFRDNGNEYHQRQDFTIQHPENINNPRVLLFCHVGSKIEAVKPGEPVRAAVRVSGGAWHWLDISSHKDDQNHWIEFPISASELKRGLNQIETTSNVGNKGNMTPESLDILASSAEPLYRRSWHTYEFKRYMLLPDRNWGIRLKYDDDSQPVSGKPASISIFSEKKTALIDDAVQFMVEAKDASGKTVDPQDVKWSATLGQIDKFGLYHPAMNGKAVIKAESAGISAKTELKIDLKSPVGVEKPGSTARLKPNVPKGHQSLNGKWQFRPDPDGVGESQKWFDSGSGGDWGEISVPGSWQAQGYGLDYHGVGWYKREFTVPQKWVGKEVWLHFDAVSTQSRVWINGKPAGEHTGDWVPFDLRITDFIKSGEPNTVVVRVDEMPNHFSIGFLPVIAPHYGGIWQSVTLFSTGNLKIDDVNVRPNLSAKKADIQASVSGPERGRIHLTVLDPGGKPVSSYDQSINAASGWNGSQLQSFSIPVPSPTAWAPDSPALYTAKFEVWQGDTLSDSRTIRFGMRDVSTKGIKLLLDGKPIFARGVLHWGYYPDLVTIDPSEDRIRKEFADLRAAGFNMVKVCLFVFPWRFYEIADEMGMLIWQEYPTWLSFPQEGGSNANYDEITREYAEWFRFDRNHPSVILRDLTCEAPNMNKELTRRVFSLGKNLIGDEVICDNSACVNHLVTDFYDCHIYEELDTFPGRWNGAIVPAMKSLGEPKPFIVGEELDQDTYRDTAAVRKALVKGGELPWWLERDSSFAMQESVEPELVKRYGENVITELIRRQNLHTLATRKAFMEEYRDKPEFAGHTMTAMRDNVITRPGFFDDLGNPKWDSAAWHSFIADRVLVLETPRRSRCFKFNENPTVRIKLSNFADSVRNVPVKWRLMDGKKVILSGESNANVSSGVISPVAEFKLTPPAQTSAKTYHLEAELGDLAKNNWPVWFFPISEKLDVSVSVYSPSGSDKLAANTTVFKTAPVKSPAEMAPGSVLVTDSLDESVRKALLSGAKVVYIAKDDDYTLPRKDTPFWREMALWLPNNHPALGDFPHEGYVDLQFLDLTQRRAFDASAFRDEITQIVWGLNARFPGDVRTDYIFEAKVGKGSLLACCFQVLGADNIAGQNVLASLARYAASDAFAPRESMCGKLEQILTEAK